MSLSLSRIYQKNRIDKFGFLLYVAKNVRITDNKSKSIVFCVFMTRSTMLFSIGTASVFIHQNFLSFMQKNFYSNI